MVELCEGVTAAFTDAGHPCSGSASITLQLDEGGVTRRRLLGDIGNVSQPIIRDPQLLKKADYVHESTYGDRKPHRGGATPTNWRRPTRRSAGRQRRHPVVRRGRTSFCTHPQMRIEGSA